MSRYVVFGDSFGKDYPQPRHESWLEMLGADTISYAHEGSSVWYSLDCLMDYLDSDNYRDTDRIIFIVTDQHRMIRYTDNNFVKYHNVITHFVNIETQNKEFNEYRKKHKVAHDYVRDTILTTKLFTTLERLIYGFMGTLTNEVLIIPAFAIVNYDDDVSPERFKKSIAHSPYYKWNGDDPKYDETFSLLRISRREYVTESNDSLRNDTRINHLAYENHVILADTIKEYFNTKDHSVFKLEKFKSGIL